MHADTPDSKVDRANAGSANNLVWRSAGLALVSVGGLSLDESMRRGGTCSTFSERLDGIIDKGG